VLRPAGRRTKLEGRAQARRGRLDGRKRICELGGFGVSIGEKPHCRPGKDEQKGDEGSYECPEQSDSEGLQDSKLVVRRGRRDSDDPADDCTDSGSLVWWRGSVSQFRQNATAVRSPLRTQQDAVAQQHSL
jgi:hypothetical protein